MLKQNKTAKTDADVLYEFDGGYACVKDNVIYIPVIMGNMRLVLDALYKKTGISKMVFTAVINPDYLKTHLHNIKKEWDEWYPEVGDYSHCIEIEYKSKLTFQGG